MKTIHFLFLSLFMFSFLGMRAQTYYFSSPQGYGAGTTGGGSGTVTIVSTKAQLQTALTASGSGVVIVQGSVQCDYLSVLITNKTLLGLPGAKLYTNDQTAGASGILYIKPGSSNVIIRNLIFVGPGAYDSDGRDCLTNEGTNVWIDHCEFQDGMDGNFDNKGSCDNVTVSWCKFTYLKTPKAGGSGGTDDHRFSNLVGSSSSDYPSDKQYSITWQYCWWAEGCRERMVRARNAQLHMVNCFWNSSVANKCLGLEDGSNGNGTQVYLEGGVFETPTSTKNIDVSYGGTPDVTVVDCIGNSLANNSSTVSKPSYSYTALSSSLVKAAVTSSCGAGATLNVTTAGVVSSSCGSSSVAVTGVSLSPASVSLSVGGTSQLTATVSPSNATNKTVSYSSGNTSVATVSSSGLITAVAAGTATITVTTADGAKTATCAVTVIGSTISGIYEGENASIVSGVTESTNSGYSGTGYANTNNASGNYVEWTVTSSSAGTYALVFRYATITDRASTLTVNSATITSLPFTSTGSWTTWTNTSAVNVSLVAGSNKIRLTATTSAGAANLDYLQVTAASSVSVSSVSVTPTSASIAAGGTQQLTASISPSNATNKTVSWSSSNTSVATVNASGLVTAVAAGSATITVTTADGAKTATSAITVTSSTTTTSIAHNFTTSGTSSSFYTISGNLSTSKGTVTYSGLTLTQCLKIESATSITFTAAQAGLLTLVFNSTYTSGIKVDGTTSANASAGVLAINLTAGTHTITKSASANLYYMSLTYSTTKSFFEGIEIAENESETAIKLFPIPVKDQLNVAFTKNLDGKALIQLYNNAGKLIVTKEMEGSSLFMDLSGIQPGLYIVKVSNGSETYTKRIIKQ